MDIIRDNIPNIIYKNSHMSINNQLFIYREVDKSFRFEHGGGQREYYTRPIDVLNALDKTDIQKVKIFFPSMNEVIQIYDGSRVLA